VDLDNSLLRVDTLHEGIAHLLSRRPWAVFALLLELFRGKVAVKQFVHKHAPLDVKDLPIREDLLAYLTQQKALGRPIGLFSAAGQDIVDACRERFGIFDIAVGTSDPANLAGRAKLRSIQKHLGQQFVYAGDSSADLPIWREANGAIYLGRSRLLRARVARAAPLELDLSAPKAGVTAWTRAFRIHQWSKNLLLLVPALLSIPTLTARNALETLIAFAALCAIASATYVINDLVDVNADRQHASKKFRPFACGAIPLRDGVYAAMLLACISGIAMLLLPVQSAITLLVYAAVSLTYSFKLKQMPILDVICLGFLFTARIAAGASLLQNSSPYWLYAFSMFFFTSLAFVKRYTELAAAVRHERTHLPGRNYQTADLPLVLAAGLGSALCSIVVFLIYLGYQHFDAKLFHNPAALGLAVASLAYWLLRVWLLALREEMNHDPVAFALRDRTSYAVGALVGFSLFLAW
jgi:4-hydroxybenzoate polyprenyltransferase